MRRTTIRWTVLVALVLAPRPLRAQGPLELTVELAVARAEAEAPRLAEARAREAAAEATVAVRVSLARPLLTASSSVLRTNHVDEFGVPQTGGGTRIIFPDIPTNYRARAEVTFPIYTAGRLDMLVASAEADRRAVELESQATASDVTLDVVTAYWNLMLTRERVAVFERALERADASLESVRARVEGGVLPPNDVLSAEAQRARQLVQLIQAQNDAALAEAQLGRLVGADPGQAIALLTPLDRPTPGTPELAALPPTTLSTRAVDGRPERQALLERQASLRSAAAAALAATRPQVSLLAGVEPSRPNPRFVPRTNEWNTAWDLGVNVTWALWDGGRGRAERAAAAAQAEVFRHRAEEFDALVGVEVRQRVLDIASTQAALAASGDAVTAAAEARRVLGERFDAGVVTNTEVLDAEVVWLEAELERTRLRVLLRLGEARLLRTVGGR